MAEGVGFEPTVAFTTPVFKTGLFDHSSTPPKYVNEINSRVISVIGEYW